MRASAPEPAVIEWLWSYEGIEWGRNFYGAVGYQDGAFASLKDDHECKGHCSAGIQSLYPDQYIKADLNAYGMGGVSDLWRREWLNALASEGESR